MMGLFVRIAVGVLVGGLLGAALGLWTATPEWAVGAGAGALSAVIGSWALHSLRAAQDEDPKPPDSPQQPSI